MGPAILLAAMLAATPTTRPAAKRPASRPAASRPAGLWDSLSPDNRRQFDDAIQAFKDAKERTLDKLDEELAAAIRIKPHPRDKVQIRLRASKIAELRKQIAEIEAGRERQWPMLTKEAIGQIPPGYSPVRISQVVNESKAIVRLGGKSFMLYSPTEDMADDDNVDFGKRLFYFGPPESYTTVTGAKRTIDSIRRLQPAVIDAMNNWARAGHPDLD